MANTEILRRFRDFYVQHPELVDMDCYFNVSSDEDITEIARTLHSASLAAITENALCHQRRE